MLSFLFTWPLAPTWLFNPIPSYPTTPFLFIVFTNAFRETVSWYLLIIFNNKILAIFDHYLFWFWSIIFIFWYFFCSADFNFIILFNLFPFLALRSSTLIWTVISTFWFSQTAFTWFSFRLFNTNPRIPFKRSLFSLSYLLI